MFKNHGVEKGRFLEFLLKFEFDDPFEDSDEAFVDHVVS